MEYVGLGIRKEARALVNLVYRRTENFPKEEQHRPTSQLRRCTISVPSNIAAGCGRRTNTGTIQFSYISRGSKYELETQLHLSLDQGCIKEADFKEVLNQIKSCKKLLNGFIN